MRQNVKKVDLGITLNVSQKNDATGCKDCVEGKGLNLDKIKRENKRTLHSSSLHQQTVFKGQHRRVVHF